jgi:uncharacterized protein
MKGFAWKDFFMKTMNGMAYGLFATLIISVIISQIGNILGIPFLLNPVARTLSMLMGAGIGLGIGLTLKLDGLKLVVAVIIGGITTSFRVRFGIGIELPSVTPVFNNPLTTYVVVVLTIVAMQKLLIKKTPVDIIIIPLFGAIVATLFTLALSAPIEFLVTSIQEGIRAAMTLEIGYVIVMSIIIAVVMGILLTSPLSSAAIAITIGLDGLAGGAAVIGCTCQMIGFAIQSRKDNNIGILLSIAFGTSMLQFKNIIKKPIIWLPTIIASAILGPIFVLVFNATSTPAGSGMGSSGLVGQLQTLESMNYSTISFLVVALQLVLAALLVYGIDLVFRKKQIIVEGDLKIGQDIT